MSESTARLWRYRTNYVSDWSWYDELGEVPEHESHPGVEAGTWFPDSDGLRAARDMVGALLDALEISTGMLGMLVEAGAADVVADRYEEHTKLIAKARGETP